MTKAQATLCRRIKQLGYAQGNQVKLYGEVFDVTSDPFCVGDDCVFIDAVEQKSGHGRRIRIPGIIVRMTKEQGRAA